MSRQLRLVAAAVVVRALLHGSVHPHSARPRPLLLALAALAVLMAATTSGLLEAIPRSVLMPRPGAVRVGQHHAGEMAVVASGAGSAPLSTATAAPAQGVVVTALGQVGSPHLAALAAEAGGGIPEVTARMNATVDRLQLRNTHFSDVTGLGNNVTTAKELAKLSRYTLRRHPALFQKVANKRTHQLRLANSSQQLTIHTTNTFDGRGQFKIMAVKTGYLPEAGRSLALRVKSIGQKGNFIIILLGSDYRAIFDDAYAVARYVTDSYEFHNYKK